MPPSEIESGIQRSSKSMPAAAINADAKPHHRIVGALAPWPIAMATNTTPVASSTSG